MLELKNITLKWNSPTEKTLIKNLSIKIENSEKKTVDQSHLKLLDIDDEIYKIPDSEFTQIVTMPSSDFQRYCRDMNSISDYVSLKTFYSSEGNVLEISCEGDFAKKKIIIGESMSLSFSTENIKNDSASGIFSLKYLMLFTKSTNLCSTVEIYLKDDFPLLLSYSIANLGQIRYCLAPKNDI